MILSWFTLALDTESEGGVFLKRGGLGDNFGDVEKQAMLESASI